MRKFIKFHLPAILYAGLIIFVSSLRNLPSPDIDFVSFDKVAHFLEYAIFALLIYRSFSHMELFRNRNISFIASFIFLILFAVMDETFQQYIPGRTSDLIDILSDTAGASIVLILAYFYQRRKDSNKIK